MRAIILAAVVSSAAGSLGAQAPSGLAARSLADTSMKWISATTPGFRAYFLADTYAAVRKDSLLARLPAALQHARSLIGAEPFAEPVDVFFIETRDQMRRLIGGSATGFAQPSSRTVLLVTNPEWRAFERHEIMHVVSGQAWGSDMTRVPAWLVEGLAQAADGMCAGFTNTEVMQALTERDGWIPFDSLLTAFRRQPDLRAYLQAAAFVEYLLREFGPSPIAEMWRGGSEANSLVRGETLAARERQWRAQLRPGRKPSAATMAAVDSKGCG